MALQFDDKLPMEIGMADRRDTLIKLFIKWKGEIYIPSKIHPAIWWCKSNPFLESQDTNVQWQVILSSLVLHQEFNLLLKSQNCLKCWTLKSIVSPLLLDLNIREILCHTNSEIM